MNTVGQRQFVPGNHLVLTQIHGKHGCQTMAVPMALIEAFMRMESEPRKYNPWTRPCFFHVSDGLRVVIPALPVNVERLWWYRTRGAATHPTVESFLKVLPDPYDLTLKEMTPELASCICDDQEWDVADKSIDWWKNEPEDVLVSFGPKYIRLRLKTRLGLWILPDGSLVTPLGDWWNRARTSGAFGAVMSNKPTASASVCSKLLARIMENFAEYEWKTVMMSYALQSPDERRARLRTVMALSVELDAIKKQDRFSTALAEGPLEDIIQGNWGLAGTFVEIFEFKDERPEIRDRYAPLWERFRDVLRAAVADAELREKGIPGGN